MADERTHERREQQPPGVGAIGAGVPGEVAERLVDERNGGCELGGGRRVGDRGVRGAAVPVVEAGGGVVAVVGDEGAVGAQDGSSTTPASGGSGQSPAASALVATSSGGEVAVRSPSLFTRNQVATRARWRRTWSARSDSMSERASSSLRSRRAARHV
ncbi:MAG: hypothetical protein WKF58_04905 [Ilumatobacteraceae bacterium]